MSEVLLIFSSIFIVYGIVLFLYRFYKLDNTRILEARKAVNRLKLENAKKRKHLRIVK